MPWDTPGGWHLNGENGTAGIKIDGEGTFNSCYGSGVLEASGYAEAAEDGRRCYGLLEEGQLQKQTGESDTAEKMRNGVFGWPGR